MSAPPAANRGRGDDLDGTSLSTVPDRPGVPPSPCRLCPACSCGFPWCRVGDPVPCELLAAVGGGRRG